MQDGLSPTAAASLVFEVYLDGKPRLSSALKHGPAELDIMLWERDYLYSLPPETWDTQAAILALTRYMHSTQFSNLRLMEHLATLAPASLRKAVRYSGLALQNNPLRRSEIV